MLKKVKRHRKRRANKRHKKEKWFDEMLRRQLFEYYQIEAFFERRRKEYLNSVFPSGGVTQGQTEDLGGECIVPKKNLTKTISHD